MGVIERKKREKELRKEQILSAGEKIFLKKGLENTTMDEIAEYCELSKGTLYLYFKSKEDLYLNLVLKALTQLYEMMKENVTNNIQIETKLRAVGEAYLNYYKKNSDYFKIINHFLDPKVFKNKPEIALIGEKLFVQDKKIWELITSVIIEGINKGIYKKDINPFEIAILLWTSSNGIIQLMDYMGKNKDAVCDKASILFVDFEALFYKSGEIIVSSIRR